MSSSELTPSTEPASREWREKSLSELYHVISQPLTGLHCLLEVSLMKRQTAAGYRRDIQTALEATSRLAEALRQARELAEAEFPGELEQVDLSALVQDVLAEFEPLLQANHITAVVELAEAAVVDANAAKLRRAVFYLFDDVLQDLPLGNRLFVSTAVGEFHVLYLGQSLASECWEGMTNIADTPRSLAVADRTVAAMGGRLFSAGEGQGRAFKIEFPLR